MALSDTVKTSLRDAQENLRNALAFSARQEKPFVSKHIADMMANIENIKDSKSYKEKYRSVLDELPLTESETNAIITEANYAFRLNMYMFDELKGNAAKSFFQIVFRAIFDRIPR